MELNDYKVLYVEHAENTVYICRKNSESNFYRVVESADKARIAKYIKYFVSCKSNEFYEDFCLNEKYYAVFSAPDGVPLKKSETALTARSVARAFAMQNPPLEIAVKMLSPDHIFICGDELEFAYDLPETDVKITWEYFFSRFADFISASCEIGSDCSIENWLADLRAGKFENMLNAYRNMPETAEKTVFSNNEKWEKIKSVLLKIAAAVAAVSAIAAAALLLLDQGGEENAEYSRIDSLGTIDLTKE